MKETEMPQTKIHLR